MTAQGWSNKRIAIELDVAYDTVKATLRNVYRRLHIDNRAELANLYGLEIEGGDQSILTREEQRICAMTMDGRTYTEIGAAIGCKDNIIKYRIRKIFKATGTKNQTELANWWRGTRNRTDPVLPMVAPAPTPCMVDA